MHLDAWLADTPLAGGVAPKLGDAHLRAITVRGFPDATWPGLLDELNRLGFGYRWVTRFICLDKAEAERELTRLRRQWFAKRKSVVALLRETIFQQESPLVDRSDEHTSELQSLMRTSYAVFCLKKNQIYNPKLIYLVRLENIHIT